MKEITKTLAKINKVNILLVENGEMWVPIKPICEALGIVTDTQVRKLKEDEILNSVTTLRVATGADKKQYEMVCIPFKYVFGWLFSINPKNVAPEAKETVLAYRKECYDVLYNHFTAHSRFYEHKQKIIAEKREELSRLKSDFRTAKNKMSDAERDLDEVVFMKYDQWEGAERQTILELDD